LAHVITEPCVGSMDRSCVDACPVDCILDAGDQLVIDPYGCVDCGACIPACPFSAIYPESEVPAEWLNYIQLNATRSSGGLPAALDR
jgi:NAD-dependent dihydropyrimidine dehydrogenase PreA subunit